MRVPPDPMFCFQQVANMMIRMKREFTGSQNSIFPVFDNLLLLVHFVNPPLISLNILCIVTQYSVSDPSNILSP